MNPPKNEEELIGQLFAHIFTSKKASNLYIKKILKRFLNDEDNEEGYVSALEMDRLQLKLEVTDRIFQEHKAPLKDVNVIPIKNVFIGPLKRNISRKWNVGIPAIFKCYEGL